ncbi:hypothetical protein K438DRAFT_1778869 [Mycena galopus ATCC 62051]|nr:hypothetical protein K438DRAFT_1778869 [Mycena galopus ATCC 62051]
MYGVRVVTPIAERFPPLLQRPRGEILNSHSPGKHTPSPAHSVNTHFAPISPLPPVPHKSSAKSSGSPARLNKALRRRVLGEEGAWRGGRSGMEGVRRREDRLGVAEVERGGQEVCFRPGAAQGEGGYVAALGRGVQNDIDDDEDALGAFVLELIVARCAIREERTRLHRAHTQHAHSLGAVSLEITKASGCTTARTRRAEIPSPTVDLQRERRQRSVAMKGETARAGYDSVVRGKRSGIMVMAKQSGDGGGDVGTCYTQPSRGFGWVQMGADAPGDEVAAGRREADKKSLGFADGSANEGIEYGVARRKEVHTH